MRALSMSETGTDTTAPAAPNTSSAEAWHTSRFSGLFREHGAVALRAHDPQVAIWAGTVSNRALTAGPTAGASDALVVGGAGWTERDAELAGMGEAIERWQTHRLPGDRVVAAGFEDWPLPDPAIAPDRWVLFHPEQHSQDGFPFEALTPATELDWVAFRDAASGEPYWVPAALAFMDLRPGEIPRFAPAISTGWSAHRSPAQALLRGVQEVIERDAVVGAWWGRYPLREHRSADILASLPPWIPPRIERRNLEYRFYHIDSPYSAHVTMVSVSGPDREGFCFSIGSACRETRGQSWQKALLEAIQGRHYVRYHLATPPQQLAAPTTFLEHALCYSLAPERLDDTVLATADPARASEGAGDQPLAALIDCLGPARPVLFRAMTPPALASRGLGWVVSRVMIPGLQPLHGDHRIPFLGGPLWGERPAAQWADIPPHPFA